MNIEKELLTHLQNEEDNFTKKVQFINNAFKSSELPMSCKTFIFKWLLHCKEEDEMIWQTVHDWVNTNNFKDLTRNEIDSKDIRCIVDAIIWKTTSEDDISNIRTVCNTVMSLLKNNIFEQYFKVDVKLCLKLIDSVLVKIQCPNYFTDFLGQPIFNKSLLSANGFLRYFLHIIFPTFVQCIVKFNDKLLFLQVSKVTQRCVFYSKHKNYADSINKLIENQHDSESGLHMLLKHLMKLYESNKKSPEIHYKVAFHAFATAYENDSLLIYKMFIVLINVTGFIYEDVLPLNSPFVVEKCVVTQKSKQILSELLDVLEETKLDLKSTVEEISVSDLLKTIFTQSIISDKSSALNYRILKKIVRLDPTITQTLTGEILKYALLTNNVDQAEEYEQLMLVIFDIFSKLHRIENLVSNITTVLKNNFGKDLDRNENFDLKTENILTRNIMECFSRNIQNLASWQIINVFKTFLFSLKEVVDNNDGLKSGNVEYCFHLEFLSELIGTFLSSVRVAEHTVAANVVEKSKKCLNDLEAILHVFGGGLLNRKHNCSLMRSFLKIAYHWAEISVVLKYYSFNQEDRTKSTSDYNVAACNITYVHTYLTGDEWCLISERITNFGELSCKQLLYKLYLQNVRALYLFEQKVTDEILQDLLRYLTRDLEDSWQFMLQNKFLTNRLLQLMDPSSMNILAEKLVVNISDFESFQKYQHIFDNAFVLKAVVYSVIVKCDKIISKRKRKHDEESVGSKKTSAKICNHMTLEIFYNEDENKNCINKLKKIYESSNRTLADVEMKFNESKVLELIEVLKKFPVVFCDEFIQKFYILYMFSVHKDLSSEFSKGNYKNLQTSIENLILGALQQCKYKLIEIFTVEMVWQDILTNFNQWTDVFVLLIDNLFKHKDDLINYEPLILQIADKLNQPTYMYCGIVILDTINKLKKVKGLNEQVKGVVEKYRSTICNRIFNLVVENDPQDHLIPGYAYTLKTFLIQNEEKKKSMLLRVLDSYKNFALRRHEQFDKIGYLQLFNTILQNKSNLKEINENLPLQIWEVCKRNDKVYARFDEYSHLVLLVVGYVSNEDFCSITKDLLAISEEFLNESQYEKFGNILKTWRSILTSNVNPVKTKNLQQTLEIFLFKIMQHLETSKFNDDLFESVFNFEITIVQTSHFHLSPAIMDILILNVPTIEQTCFEKSFNLAVALLSNLLKYRKSLIMDRLPPYLQRYRALLKDLCSKSNADIPQDEDTVRQSADCAFQLERLTKSLVMHPKDLSRIATYLIANILEQYEKVTILPNVKMHLNNCVYSLITICDQHAVSYLMRVLSSASTEIFKVMYDHYKKYYRFTGKA